MELDKAANNSTAAMLEILDKVEDLMKGIGRHFSLYLDKLPTEVQRLSTIADAGELLAALDAIIRDHVLDNFLKKHTDCRELFIELFGSRYPYLGNPNLRPEEKESCDETQTLNLPTRQDGEEAWTLHAGPFADAFRPRPEQIENEKTLHNKVSDHDSWVVSYTTQPTSETSILLPAHSMYDCIDAYNKFDVVPHHQISGVKDANQLSTEELELAERMYHVIQSTLELPSIEEVVARVPNMAHELKMALIDSDLKWSEISPEIKKQVQIAIISDADIHPGIELEIELASSSSELSDMDMDEDETELSELAIEDIARAEGTNASHGTQTHLHKDRRVEGPVAHLQRAKNFLTNSDIGRTVDWKRKVAGLTEYLACLHKNSKDEDWVQDFKEVADMLQTHRIFEKYYYGDRKLVVNFPTNTWPKESKRLPRLPGPDIVMRPESSEQRGLTGPRQLLHTPISSAHDQQYEMPIEVLKEYYLQPYWEDAKIFWANDLQQGPENIANLVQCENSWYEDCRQQGIVHTAKLFLSNSRVIHSPAGIYTSSDGTQKMRSEHLESFARFRGTKRAALQSCLNVFDNSENRKLCSAWRTLTLPKRRAQKKPDAGVIYPCMMMNNPPKKESRDPWAYTRAYQWFKKEDLRWSQWTKEHAIKDSYGHRRWLCSEEPVMELPKNWLGPVLSDLMDQDMRKTYELLRRCQKIHQGLTRVAKWAPREFIRVLNKMVDAGLRAESCLDEKLEFAYHEFTTKDRTELARIRPTEMAWLEYICQPSRNRPAELKESLGAHGEAMLFRVVQLMQDISPMALFRDTEPRTMVEFLKELNLVCRGPVKRRRFSEEDVMRMAPKLNALKVLAVYKEEDGELMFGRPSTEFHPEDLVKWPEFELEQGVQEEQDPESVFIQRRLSTYTGIWDVTMKSDDTISTELTVPRSIDDFHQYPKTMPRKKDVLSLKEYIKNPERDQEDRKRTRNFFYCMGYRLGMTLNALQEQHNNDQARLDNPEKQEYNKEFLDTIIDYWDDDTRKRPNDNDKNPAKNRFWRITLIYPDLVKIADPETYKTYKQKWTMSDWPDQNPAIELVREHIVREVYENKSMLWPLPLPYDTYATEYKVVDGSIARQKRESLLLKKFEEGRLTIGKTEQINEEEEEEDDNDASNEKKESDTNDQRRQAPKTLRREPAWSFGHPSRKPVAHLFWDINNWPIHLQTKEKQETIRSRGPERQSKEATQKDINVTALGQEDPAHEIPFWKRAMERSKFVLGSDEFWAGDTPLQRKVFETRIRERLESKPKTIFWPERILTAIFGDVTHKPVTDEDLVLPDLAPHMIPRSQPLKEADEDTGLFIPTTTNVAAGEGDDNTPTIPIVVRPVPVVEGEMQEAAINYHIPDEPPVRSKGYERDEMGVVGQPYIEYCTLSTGITPGVASGDEEVERRGWMTGRFW